MKKTLITLFIPLVLLASCGGNNSDPDVPVKTDFEKAVETISNFSVKSTNGYDYYLKQYLGNTVSNSHEIKLRASFDNDVKAKKEESSKTLNEFNLESQYTIENVTTYFLNNRKAEYNGSTWKWTNCKESEYFASNISSFQIKSEYFENIKESKNNSYVFKADIIQTKVNDFFKLENSTIEEAKISIELNNNLDELLSVSISYFQSKTYTEFSFETYSGAVDIDIPQ